MPSMVFCARSRTAATLALESPALRSVCVRHAQKFFGRGAAAVRAERLDAREDHRGGFSANALVGDGSSSDS